MPPRQRRRVVALAFLSVCLLPLSAHALDQTKNFLDCQKALDKQGAGLVKLRTKYLGQCVEALLACQLAFEVDGAPLAPCQTAATARCNDAFAGAGAADSQFASKVALKCGLSDTGFRSRRGLGFRDDADACAALTPPGSVVTTAQGLACAQRAADCTADDRIEQMEPRAYELLNAVGLASSAPCIDVRAAAPAGAGSSSSSALLLCAVSVDKYFGKVERLREKGIRTCTGGLLRCDLPADRIETTIPKRDACRAGVVPSCTAKRAVVTANETTRNGKFVARCGTLAVADVKDRLGFGAICPGAATVADIGDCLAASLEPRTQHGVGELAPRGCELLTAAGQLTGYEGVCVPSCGNGVVEAGEACDDGNGDNTDTCTNTCTPGPVAQQTIFLPSTAAPAHSPDGTAGTAVAPGSTLATQFGSTMFNLNRATYTRYYAIGAGDPDTILVTAPGFAAGAGAFKIFAESLIVKAEAAGNIRLEVWAIDRRSNFLEDRAGVGTAEPTFDYQLALNWFFGGQMGLPLDPRISRRAVFHDGPTVAFMANWTPNVHAHDIDAVIDAAHAVPSNPTVFLGGHSLGTLFTGRYASTDLDPGPGIVPGFSKVAGLVLLEGGGGAVPASPPTSDQLDKVIAKADGGLYHAVQDGASRCVDGTACTTDADCSAVTLPPGAVTNKCVAPVDAFTGANTSGVVFIDPQIQAAGDVTGLQGVLDPDGLVAIEQDYGGGSAVDTVPGLGILGALPPASTSAGLGFFLDDDFSPVSAFRASFGYSNDGLNNVILGIVVPGPSGLNPYRQWINIDQPMPAAAIPNNGPATATLSHDWGQEKEVTNLSRFFPVLFTGGTDFGDWYFPASGLSVTSDLDPPSPAFGGLDSTALSVGRNRPDIENLTQASAINIPVIAFGGSNGLTPTAANYTAFANSIGTCTAPTCDGTTPRLVTPDPITPTFGNVAGGFEVYISEGYAHIDVLTAEDDPSHNNVLAPLLAFLTRNTP
jgi:cysteine-rich repeat protein